MSELDADRVVAALQRYLLQPGEEIEHRRDWPEAVDLRAGPHQYEARPAGWLVGREPWVEAAVRVAAEREYLDNTSRRYGLVFPRNGEVLFLNDVATMRELGRRLAADLDPLAYAELLSELYSGSRVDGPVVTAYAATASWPAGQLVRDVEAFAAVYHWVDTGLVAAPVVRRENGGVVMEFFSCHYYLTGMRAVDVLRWRVTGGGGRPASWHRDYVAKRLEHIGLRPSG